MITIFTLTAPFYGLILLGYLSLHFKLLQLHAIKPLNTFVLFIALPAMLFRFGVQLPIAQLLDSSSVFIYGSSALILVSASVLWSWRFERPRHWGSTGFAALVSAFPNTGFLGLPLLTTLLGAQAAGPTLVSLVFDLLITSTVCMAFALLGAAQNAKAATALATTAQAKFAHGQLLRQLGRGLVQNPMPWAIVAGALCSWQGLEPVPIVQGVVYRLADAASPLALFMIGAVIYRARHLPRAAQAPDADAPDYRRPVPKMGWAAVLPFTGFKLWLHPLLIGLMASVWLAAGQALAHATLVTLVLLAALPSGSNVSLLAERMDGNNDRVATVTLLCTVLALPSFTLIATLLNVRV